MAYHEPFTGHTKPIVGAVYTKYLAWAFSRATLKKHNAATGMCFITFESGGSCYISESELSKWHLLNINADEYFRHRRF
jgi:hypothetical protein